MRADNNGKTAWIQLHSFSEGQLAQSWATWRGSRCCALFLRLPERPCVEWSTCRGNSTLERGRAANVKLKELHFHVLYLLMRIKWLFKPANNRQILTNHTGGGGTNCDTSNLHPIWCWAQRASSRHLQSDVFAHFIFLHSVFPFVFSDKNHF